MKTFTLALVVLVCLAAAAQDELKVERTVEGNTLTSQSLPSARLTFAAPFRYVGAQRFVLYGVADAEQHFFVDADKAGHIRRLYWLQFEHFLPSNTDAYGYKAVRSA